MEAAEMLWVELRPPRYVEVLTLRTSECDRTGNTVIVGSDKVSVEWGGPSVQCD